MDNSSKQSSTKMPQTCGHERALPEEPAQETNRSKQSNAQQSDPHATSKSKRAKHLSDDTRREIYMCLRGVGAIGALFVTSSEEPKFPASKVGPVNMDIDDGDSDCGWSFLVCFAEAFSGEVRSTTSESSSSSLSSSTLLFFLGGATLLFFLRGDLVGLLLRTETEADWPVAAQAARRSNNEQEGCAWTQLQSNGRGYEKISRQLRHL